jgi:hypothetical protein
MGLNWARLSCMAKAARTARSASSSFACRSAEATDRPTRSSHWPQKSQTADQCSHAISQRLPQEGQRQHSPGGNFRCGGIHERSGARQEASARSRIPGLAQALGRNPGRPPPEIASSDLENDEAPMKRLLSLHDLLSSTAHCGVERVELGALVARVTTSTSGQSWALRCPYRALNAT